MCSTLPPSVSDQSWEAWEAGHLQKEVVDAALAITNTVDVWQDATDTGLSCVSEADRCTSRLHKNEQAALQHNNGSH